MIATRLPRFEDNRSMSLSTPVDPLPRPTASSAPGLITGQTRLYAILGDPIAQVQTPQAINRLMAERGVDGVMVPMQVAAADLAAFAASLRCLHNFGGMVVTVPHKTAMTVLCDHISPAAAAVGAINVVRREADGRLVGEMLDGQGFVAGLRQYGIAIDGKSAFLAGAGGAANAIAFALADAGLARLTVYNRSPAKVDAMIERLARHCPAMTVQAGSGDPAGHDLVINATSLGMQLTDALPLSTALLTADQTVAEIIMQPVVTPLLAAAQAKGCRIHYGAPMLDCQIGLMADFIGIPTEVPNDAEADA